MVKTARIVTKHVRIWDILSGNISEKEGNITIKTRYGEKLRRVLVVGTVVRKIEGENHVALIIDDSTDTIRVRFFDTNKIDIEEGDDIMVIGRVRMFKGEIYINCEFVKKISTEFEMLHRVRVMYKITIFRKVMEIAEKDGIDSARKFLKDLGESSYFLDEIIGNKQWIEKEKDLKKEIIEIMGDSGASKKYIAERLNMDVEVVDSIIDEMLKEGICFEERPGFIKKV